MSDKVYTLADGTRYEIRRAPNGGYLVRREGTGAEAAGARTEPHTIDHQTKRLYAERGRGRRLFWVYAARSKRVLSWPGGSMEIEAADPGEAAAAGAGALKPLRLTMPGKVLSIKVREGDVVESGQGLVVVEAMKMENLLLASAPAKVAKIHVRAGDRLESGATLITFEAPA